MYLPYNHTNLVSILCCWYIFCGLATSGGDPLSTLFLPFIIDLSSCSSSNDSRNMKKCLFYWSYHSNCHRGIAVTAVVRVVQIWCLSFPDLSSLCGDNQTYGNKGWAFSLSCSKEKAEINLQEYLIIRILETWFVRDSSVQQGVSQHALRNPKLQDWEILLFEAIKRTHVQQFISFSRLCTQQHKNSMHYETWNSRVFSNFKK